ncbi:universal stress protein [Gryllotalpicola protaetiae]|uniref:Universal stress protein n=1 Tax=Gryllotalpicola protaetiae TaxID=2419771 RepID=A0A387BP19_9MICO|nr:universal stress protein [Gryllotalpicola protaetiae]AYG02740.1 universal stress protein [Gryllotalpicola protaetiae]
MNEYSAVNPEIVVGIDGSPEALGALREALRLADALDGKVRVICAWAWPVGQGFVAGPPINWNPESDALEILATSLRKVEVPAGVEVTTEAVYGDAAEILIEASQRAYMVLTGSTGAGMARALFLGSVSTRVAQRAACPVLVWRPSAVGLAADSALREELALNL